MKYIVLEVTHGGSTRELPVIFPELLVHANVAKALATMRGLENAKPISAGFLSSMDVSPACHGASESLELKSRGKVDDNLIMMHDYLHGIC